MHRITSTCRGGGYTYCKTEPVHPKSNSKGLYPLHRVLVENSVGRYLKRSEHVHHIDENKSNNVLSNLLVLTIGEHTRLHLTHNPIIIKCPNCNENFEIKEHAYRLREKRNKNKMVFCSRACATKKTHRK